MKRIGMVMLIMTMIGAVVSANGSQSTTGSTGAGPARITVEIFDRGTDGGKTDPANNQWTKWIQQKILKDENIIVEFVKVSRWAETDALVNLFAAGTPPDVCYTYSIDNIQNWSEQGGILDLAPYIDTTLKDLKAFLGPDKALVGKDLIRRNIDTSTGQIFSIPARRMNVAQRNIFIRKDWLDTLGLPLPKTTQEFYDALVAFKTKDPGKVGLNKVVPFIMDGDRVDWGAGNIMEAFIDPKISDKERWINTVSERSFNVPGYKEGVRFMNKMFNAGLIDKDFPLYKSGDDTRPLIQSGVVGAFSGDWDIPYREPNGLLSGLRKNVPNGDFVPIDPIQSSDGITHKSAYDAAGIFFFIPKSCKNPDAAMRYLNWLAKYENYHFLQTGPEGITHTVGSDGVVKIDASAAKDPSWIMNSNQNIDYTMMMNGLFLESEEASIRALAAGYSYPADIISRSYTTALTNARPALVVKTTSPLVVAGPLNQTLADRSKIVFSATITCPESQFDAVYDREVKAWLEAGAQAVIDERRAKYPQ
ncbi:MAG: extracellular solute-binding protein [Spirochaetaceae bacterium]|jgi:putative aldouronate transport system substrate-binding protein|nr:extracellular solute-binding protein [Spirochaetaceae bacterium]